MSALFINNNIITPQIPQCLDICNIISVCFFRFLSYMCAVCKAHNDDVYLQYITRRTSQQYDITSAVRTQSERHRLSWFSGHTQRRLVGYRGIILICMYVRASRSPVFGRSFNDGKVIKKTRRSKRKRSGDVFFPFCRVASVIVPKSYIIYIDHGGVVVTRDANHLAHSSYVLFVYDI